MSGRGSRAGRRGRLAASAGVDGWIGGSCLHRTDSGVPLSPTYPSDLYFLLDNLLALNTAILVKGERLLEDRRTIAYRYFSWETFQRGDRWCFPVFLMEFVPFYGGLLLSAFVELPDWFLPICAAFRARRMADLLSYFHALEVSE